MNKFVMLGVAAIVGSLIGIDVIYSYQQNEPENVQKILEQKGFTNVKVGNYNYWCAKGVAVRRHFEAKDQNGVEVEGKICEGLFWSINNSVSTEPIVKNPKMSNFDKKMRSKN